MKTQKILIALVVVLCIGVVVEGVHLARLKKQVAGFEGRVAKEAPKAAALTATPKAAVSQGTPKAAASKEAAGTVAPGPAAPAYPRVAARPAYGPPWRGGSLFDETWEPFAEMRRMQEQFNRIFDESFGRGMMSRGLMPSPGEGFFEPAIDIKEEADHYIVKLDLPGMEKDKINIEVSDKVLTVSGERETLVEENEGDTYHRKERSYGRFMRSFPLPDDVNEKAISADYKDGVLTIGIQKLPAAEGEKEGPRTIQVS